MDLFLILRPTEKKTQNWLQNFFRDVFFSMGLILVVLIAVAEICLSFWLPNQIIYLIMLILPGIPFIGLFGICSGLLQCEKYFFLTGISPVAYNLIWIGAVWFFRNDLPESAAIGLSIAISFAFFFQWFITFPKTISYVSKFLSWRELFSFRLFSSEIRLMFSSLSFGVIGVAAAQVSSAIDPLFARYSSLEGPSFSQLCDSSPAAAFGSFWHRCCFGSFTPTF